MNIGVSGLSCSVERCGTINNKKEKYTYKTIASDSEDCNHLIAKSMTGGLGQQTSRYIKSSINQNYFQNQTAKSSLSLFISNQFRSESDYRSDSQSYQEVAV